VDRSIPFSPACVSEWLRGHGCLYSPPEYTGEWRCDLHPRFSADGRKVVTRRMAAAGSFI
jgi:hypothetical protein